MNPTRASSFRCHFRELDNLLAEWHWLWSEVPFKQPQLSWYDHHPHWRIVLRDIDDSMLEALAADPTLLNVFAREELGIRLPQYPDYSPREDAPYSDSSICSSTLQPSSFKALTKAWRSATR